MRKLRFVLYMIILVLLSVLRVFAENLDLSPVRIFADGSEVVMEKLPVIENSRTLAHVRPVAEACGINVGWNGDRGEVTLSKGAIAVTLTIGSTDMKVYNAVIDEMDSVTLETAPVIMDSATYIVLRPALEALGAGVEWDSDNKIINISSTAADLEGDKGNGQDNDTEQEALPSKGAEYTGFRQMYMHTITRAAPHGLYGRILSVEPITLVRCRIAGTSMDYTLFFKKEDNLTNYNVFTYFDKLICFSDAGLGKQTFEVYAGINGEESKLIFSYDYTVVADSDSDVSDSTTEPQIGDRIGNEQVENDVSGGITEENPSSDKSENDTVPETNATLGYYGFRKMTNDRITEGAPHGLYGTVVSDTPLASVRCRIAGTDRDYKVEFSDDEEIYQYNVFNYFDPIMCFSDAGLGVQKFDLFASADNGYEQHIFSYTYTVVGKEDAFGETVINTGLMPDESDVCLPLEGIVKVTSPYGFRAYNKWEFHKGVDIISDSLAIIAVADGTVIDCATGRNSGVGNYVAIQHEGDWVSLYYHLASYDVEIGDKVKKGQRIATMGNTGGNYGVHLHFMTCDNWYGTIWATQNNHHKPPHEYVPQLLSDVVFYNPCFEKINTDKMILCTFRFPSVLEKGSPFSISSSRPFVASENPLKSITLTITDTDGNVQLSESMENPEYTVSGLYTYTYITAAFDMICEFDKLPLGKMKVTVSTVSELGRERLVYEKDFEVVAGGEADENEKAEAEAVLTPEEAAKTDAFETTTADASSVSAIEDDGENTEKDADIEISENEDSIESVEMIENS